MAAKKQNKNWIIILGILIIALLIYIPLQPKEPTAVPENITNLTKEPVLAGIQKGDLVTLNFVLSLEDGTVVDTNNADLAKQYELENYATGPVKLIVGKSGKVKGFDNALIGLAEGASAQKSIEPSEKILFIEKPIREKIVRQQALPRVQKFPLAAFKGLFGKPAIKGTVVYNPELVFKYQVLNVTEKNAWAQVLVKQGEEYTLQGNQWSSHVLEVGEKVFTVVHNPEDNQTFETDFGIAVIELKDRSFYLNHRPELNRVLSQAVDIGKEFNPLADFKITEVSETAFLLRRVNYLPQEHLTLDVEVLSIEKINS